ncbi:hypothetical protein C8J57DRAFT_1582209 [Mycena rebaudengoi]|nr:hypothetical protein C8J57DRAFT_1582209 [Mycena rebaudengoi]
MRWPKAKLKPPNRTPALPDVLWTFLRALKESADTFPPPKSAVGGVVAIWDIAEDRGPRHRVPDKNIVDLIADAVPDGSEIPPSMLLSIDQFTFALDEIRCGMEGIALSGSLSRLAHLNHHDRTIQGIKTRLDAEYRDFLAASALRVEVQQAANALIQAQMQSDIKMVSASTDSLPLQLSGLLFYSRFAVFLARP